METQRLVGTFSLDSSTQYFGEIDFNKDETTLQIFGQGIADFENASTIRGVSDRTDKITCIECQSRSVDTIGFGDSANQRIAIFPHFVSIGKEYLSAEEPCIAQVSFSFTDITSIFKDWHSFGSIMDAGEELQAVLNARRPGAGITAGKNSIISYFSGDYEVLQVKTSIGEVLIWNQFEVNLKKPFAHDLRVAINFEEHVTFLESIKRVLALRSFFTMLTGRAQEILNLEMGMKSDSIYSINNHLRLKIYWSFAPIGPTDAELVVSRIRDLPVHGTKDQTEFAVILGNWIDRHQEWHVPRIRYVECIEMGRHYTPARIIAAANMFDILPKGSVPLRGEISDELRLVTENARQAFEALPDSAERNSILGAFGRIGKPSLPQKVYYRADVVLKHFHGRLSHLKEVLKVAVQCRNYFVHGSAFDYDAYEKHLDFLTDTLEFVFAASDFIESGWNAAAWSRQRFSGDHQFAFYLGEYDENIGNFLQSKK